MKWILVSIALFGCHAAPTTTVDASPTHTSVDEVVVMDDVRDAAPTVKLLDLDGSAPPSAKFGGLLLCEMHSVWKPPAGFVATKIDAGIVARSPTRPDELVAILFPPHADRSYATVVAKLATGAITWDTPTLTKIDDWHTEQMVHGRASNMTFAVRTLPNKPKDTLFIAAGKTEAESDALLADAKKNTLMLVDHACECGSDCLPARDH